MKVNLVSRFLIAMLTVGVATSAAKAVELFSEDFDGLALKDSVEESLAGTGVWTDEAPVGWDVIKDVPGQAEPADNNGVQEWIGWNFADRDWWIAAAEDQGRSEFTNASGTVAVVDPDEWDDAPHPDYGGPTPADSPNTVGGSHYDSWLLTPQIDVSGVLPGTVVLEFDSSWRPEFDSNYQQSADINVSFDGGAPITVLNWSSDSNNPDYKADTTNEHLMVPIDNPGGASNMQITFGMFDAGNDWWWAIDNVAVNGQAVPEPSSIAIFLIAGLAACLGVIRRRNG